MYAGLIITLAAAGSALAADFLWDAPAAPSRPLVPLGDRPVPESDRAKHPKATVKSAQHRAALKLPDNFDAGKQWPQCESIRTIRNQGSCNTCWAVAAASVLSDRLCITSGKKEFISGNYAAGCSFDGQTPLENCNLGGYSQLVFRMAAMEGITSGGEFNSSVGCVPYTVSPIENGNVERVPISCPKACSNSKFKTKFQEDTTSHQIDSYWILPYKPAITQADIDANVAYMQEEIYKNGPIATRMDVWTDFQDWQKSDGPYSGPKPGATERGGHAIRLTGWGKTEKGVRYWIIANSWGTEFGEKGYYWMEMGKNVVAIEGTPTAPVVNYTSPTVCKKESFCESIDQVFKMDYKDPKSPTFMFKGECMMEVKRDAKTGKLSLDGEPTYIAKKILNGPKPPITSFMWRDGKIGLFNANGGAGIHCEKNKKGNKWLCEESQYDKKREPATVTAAGMSYSYGNQQIYAGDVVVGQPQPIDARTLFNTPTLAEVTQFLDIDGSQMYVFGKGPKGKMVIGIVEYIKNVHDLRDEFKWVTKPGAASKFFTC